MGKIRELYVPPPCLIFSQILVFSNMFMCSKRAVKMAGESIMREEPPAKRLDDMFIIDKLIFKEQPPTFLLCVVPGRKSDIYGLSYLA